MEKRRLGAVIGLAAFISACQPSTPNTSNKPIRQLATPQTVIVALPPPASVAESADLAPDAFFAQASQSVVVVRNPDASALGSGVEIRPGVFVTNCHVLRNGYRYFVQRDQQTYPASITQADSFHDICLLHANAGEPHPVRTRSALNVKVGEHVYALGNPEGFELTLSEGLVSQLRKATSDQIEPYIQTNAAISHGSSGGGLFDRKGRLIGISSFMASEGQNLNFAAPIDWALALDSGKEIAAAAPKAMEEDTAKSLNARAIALIKGDNPEDAIPLLQKASQMDPDNAEIAGNLGYSLLLSSKYDDARTALLGALKLAPKRASTWLNLGQVYAELGDMDSAIRCEVNGYKLSSRKQKVRDALSHVSDNEAASDAWKQAAVASVASIDALEADH